MVSLPPGITAEIFYDGQYNSITGDVRQTAPLTVKRGLSSEGNRAKPVQGGLTIDNRSGDYSPRNPNSSLFGKIGRNTPIRIGVNAGEPDLAVSAAGDRATTPDTAALDITGDIDIRVDARLDNWGQETFLEIAAKQEFTTDERSWRLVQLGDSDAVVELVWTTDGTGGTGTAVQSTVPLPALRGERIAIRVTLDVDNGASGHTVTWYTAPTIDGPWQQLGDAVTGAGTTSIYDSNAPLDVGDVAGMLLDPPVGRYYAFQLLDGIDGTLVADVDFTAQSVGDTQFDDDVGLTWTLEGDAEITDKKIRLAGEVPAWPARRDLSGVDVRAETSPAGILRRLGAGKKALHSAMRRELENPERAGIVAYWPGEDGSDAQQIASAIEGHPAMVVSGGADLAAYSDWAASRALPLMKDGTLTAAVPAYTVTDHAFLRFFLRVDPDGVADETPLLTLDTTGTAAQWRVTVNEDGNLRVLAYDDEGTEIYTSPFLVFDLDGLLLSTAFELTQNGADIDWVLRPFDIAASTLAVAVDIGLASDTVSGETFGRITRIRIGTGGGLADTAVGHIALASDDDAYANTNGAIVGWAGERAGTRFLRITEEQGITSWLVGDEDEGIRLGPQRPLKLLDILDDLVVSEGGFLTESQTIRALVCRQRSTLYNQSPALTLDFSQGLISPPFQPVDDDKLSENDVTVKREGGSHSRRVRLSGPLSVQDPPDGIGRYDVEHPRSLEDDAQTAQLASWLLHLGTFDGMRYTSLTLDLANERVNALVDDILRTGVGDLIRLTDLPEDLPPGDVDLIVRGSSETIGPKGWKITFTCVPGEPYTVAETAEDDPDDDAAAVRADTGESELAAGIDSTDTEILVHTPGGRWVASDGIEVTDDDDLPFDVRITPDGGTSGEIVTVTAVEDAVWDEFGRTETGSWGDADSGQTWALTGAAADFDVTGGYGSATQPATGIAHLTAITAPGPDIDLHVDIATDVLAAGASLFAGPTIRMDTNANFYMARLEFDTSAGIAMTIRKRVDNVEAQLAPYTSPLTHVAGTFYRVRFQVEGSTLRARLWESGAREPRVWHAEADDTDLTDADTVGTRSFSNTGNTNTDPELRFDNFQVRTPQRWTVTRSTNGVSRTWDAGDDVRLAIPPIVPL